MKTRAFFVVFLIIFLCLPLLSARPAAAQPAPLDDGFNPNYILSDDDIFNVNAMSRDRLITFLRSKGTLADRKVTDIDGIEKPAVDIIWRVATSYKINPKYLVALLQKEQSLVEDPSPDQGQFDWAAGYGVCDSCSKTDPAVLNFKGFAAQLEWAAKQHREKYLLQLLGRGTTIGGQAVGKKITIDGRQVTPLNNATAMLYTYTPHIHGNLNLWRIWQRWYKVKYPDGTVVRAQPSGKIYVIRLGERRPFASPAVASAVVDEKKVIDTKDDDIKTYPLGAPIKFPPYSLLRDPNNRLFLLTSAESMRRIDSKKTFDKFGFNEDEIEDVTKEDLASYTLGLPITATTTFPQGVLMKTATDNSVWYIEDEKRHALLDKGLLSLYFQGRRVRTVKASVLQKYPLGEPERLHDGELVRGASSPSVFVIENGKRRPIPSASVFEGIGWNWKNVVTVSDKLLALHELGEPITLEQASVQLTMNNL